MPKQPKNLRENRMPSGWDRVASWYEGWVGEHGSDHHRNLAIPAVLDLLELQANERVLDMGCGHGVLAPHIAQAGAAYTGIDVSPRLIQTARRLHGRHGHFVHGDARRLERLRGLKREGWDAVVFLLSIQDMNPLQDVIRAADWALAPGGRVVILMTHPCFHIPRQSGWGYDQGRRLHYRRVDHYLTPLSIPVKPYPGRQNGTTISFHRPLSAYVNALARHGLLIDSLREITTFRQGRTRAEQAAHEEIPVFLALRARKLE